MWLLMLGQQARLGRILCELMEYRYEGRLASTSRMLRSGKTTQVLVNCFMGPPRMGWPAIVRRSLSRKRGS